MGDFQLQLNDWYKKYARVLPWRQDPTLYKTVVSEFMLQQTQVNTVLPFFTKWMKVLPNFEALSAASEDAVLLLWAGLGYYSRARHLKQLADYFLTHKPSSYQEWLGVKGVGKYTAAAIASIAFNEPVAVVDGNVVRVLSRIFNISDTFKNKSAAFNYFQPMAQDCLFLNEPGNHNQAMMELGATICTTRQPTCWQCPIQTFCRAYQNNNIANCPNFAPTKNTKNLKIRIWAVNSNKILLQKISRDKKTSLKGFYELPEFNETLQEAIALRQLFFEQKRSIGKCVFTEKIFFANLKSTHFNDEHFQWVDLKEISSLPLSGPHKRWIEAHLPLNE